MTTFHYKGLTSGGNEVDGIIEAFDEKEALLKAREHCRTLISIEPVSKLSGLMRMDLAKMFSGGKIKPKHLSLMCSQLSIELKAGLPLVASLRLVAENEEKDNIRKMLLEVADDVHAGNGLADSFALRGPYLPRTFIETIRAGEEAGRLDDSFERMKVYYENSAAVSSKVGSALIYPALLIAVAIIVVGIIMIVAVPVFEDSFASMGNELPGVTKVLIAISHFFVDYWLLMALIIVAAALGIMLFGKTDKGRHFYAKLALTFPGLCLVNKMNAATEFAATMSTMLASGLPLVQATQITAATASNLLISEDIMAACNGVIEGNRLSDGLRQSKWLPNLLLEMSSVGEETGRMEETLDVINEYYTKEVDVAVKRALEIMNPAITMVLAGLVVFILLSVYLPIFSMYE